MLTPGTYPYLANDTLLVGDIVHRAGVSGTRTLVLNDAELAAHAATLDQKVKVGIVTLVVTLGRYVGGAILNRLP